MNNVSFSLNFNFYLYKASLRYGGNVNFGDIKFHNSATLQFDLSQRSFRRIKSGPDNMFKWRITSGQVAEDRSTTNAGQGGYFFGVLGIFLILSPSNKKKFKLTLGQ